MVTGDKAMTSSSVTTADPVDPMAAAAPGAGKFGMWTFLVTDAMGFGALLLGYAVLRTRAQTWPNPMERLSIPLAAAMTFTLLTSSLTVMLAVAAMRKGSRGRASVWLAVTVFLGLLFVAGQGYEYRQLLTGPQHLGLSTDLFASTFYTITGFHGLHVLAGVIYLGALLMLTLGAARKTSATHLEVAALFWHFVDFAWVAIFTFVYLLPTV
jgi:heme/copper-type cytochrome/quinol oxidase subunit 3